ncbi:MAG: divalent-cation tolerance protein CutA [Opitutaceae bacterium]|nr:divalent-cation tolerance protein CutA [Opitutaceae bacterium]
MPGAALKIGWTTLASAADAERLSRELVHRSLAVCCQIDGPIQSIYRWKEEIEAASEYRLTVKFLAGKESHLETLLLSLHPYDTPEWVVVDATSVSEKYLSWARSAAQS